MHRKIKLIWDFRGPESYQIAKHHAIHLEEFARKEVLEYLDCGVEQKDPMYCTAYITVEEKLMPTYRDALLPHRGELG